MASHNSLHDSYFPGSLAPPTPYSDMPQVDAHSELEVDGGKGMDTFKETASYRGMWAYEGKEAVTTPANGRIWGYKKRTFIIIAAVAGFIIIIAAVGGGVGGAIAGRNKAKSSSNNASQASGTDSGSDSNSESSPSASNSNAVSSPGTTAIAIASSISSSAQASSFTTKTPTLTTVVTSSPQYTLLSDCPSSNNTIYYPSGEGPNAPAFVKMCGGASYVNSLGQANTVETPTTTLDQCIGLCAAYNVANGTNIAAGTNNPCNAVCWRSTISGNDLPGICFGFTTQNSSGTWNMKQGGEYCDSAGWINQDLS